MSLGTILLIILILLLIGWRYALYVKWFEAFAW